MLGVTLMSTQGFSSPQVQQTYAHARQLCQQLGSTPQLFRRSGDFGPSIMCALNTTLLVRLPNSFCALPRSHKKWIS